MQLISNDEIVREGTKYHLKDCRTQSLPLQPIRVGEKAVMLPAIEQSVFKMRDENFSISTATSI